MSRIIFQESYIVVVPSFSKTEFHKHPFMHLFFGRKGCKVKVDKKELQGNIILLDSNVKHAVEDGSGCEFFLLIDPTSAIAERILDKYVSDLFITHADVDHCGGIDVCGTNIFPNAKVYLGKEEKAYLNGTTHRMIKLGVKLKNCVQIADGYYAIEDGEIFDTGGIKVHAIHTPGHTLGHMCYVVDDKVLFTGDCLAVNDNGGYSFFDFFTQYPDMNKKSLLKLKKLSLKIYPEYVCTGHSGMRAFSEKIFAHMNESAPFSRKRPFDNKAPYDICN